MSSKLPAVKPKDLIRVLEKKGWHLDRVRGSHHIMVHPVLKKALPVPMHNRDLHPEWDLAHRRDKPRRAG